MESGRSLESMKLVILLIKRHELSLPSRLIVCKALPEHWDDVYIVYSEFTTVVRTLWTHIIVVFVLLRLKSSFIARTFVSLWFNIVSNTPFRYFMSLWYKVHLSAFPVSKQVLTNMDIPRQIRNTHSYY